MPPYNKALHLPDTLFATFWLFFENFFCQKASSNLGWSRQKDHSTDLCSVYFAIWATGADEL